jgi:hypothetical protein
MIEVTKRIEQQLFHKQYHKEEIKVPNQEKMFNNSSNQSTLVEEGMPLFKK